jgi:hypothetical protein
LQSFSGTARYYEGGSPIPPLPLSYTVKWHYVSRIETREQDILQEFEMDTTWTAIIWRQVGAAIDMLENALRACPDELWSARLWDNPSQRSEFSEFWYIVYHTLFWLDLYLSGSVEGFAPPAPFRLDELDPAGLLPDRRYTKDELQSYLDYGRQKCRAMLKTLPDENTQQIYRFS